MHTPDITDENIEKIAALFPNCITEMRQKKGAVTRAIDFDQLRQELSKSPIVDGLQERYQLNWPGKHEALVHTNTPTSKTLRPCREESVDFDNTKNLFIEGDNLDALKLLQETYLNKIKAIYIDPPYNTGNDFIYKDDFSESKKEYSQKTYQVDNDGNRMVLNSESNGRFHSDWLSMMYVRLKLARNLLRDDGVIFISIDDGEFENLKKLCNEIFGEPNFIETFIWKKKTAPNNVVVGSVHEYILLYAKNVQEVKLLLLPRDEAKDDAYKNPDNDPRGRWKPDNLTAAAKGGRITPSLVYTIENPVTGKQHRPPEGRMWIAPLDVIQEKIKDGSIYWGQNGDGRPMDKRFLSQTRNGMVASTMLDDVGSNSSASKFLNNLFDGVVVFETPKPVEMILRFCQISLEQEDIILDFFAGSATTAHAVMELNAAEQKQCRYILVQFPEKYSENSSAYIKGYSTIAEVSKERIRRSSKQIKEDHKDKAGIEKLDVGFRVLKIDESNMKDIYYTPNEMTQSNLVEQIAHIREDRTSEDLLFQILLDLGVGLTLPITQKKICGKTVFFVDLGSSNALVACFDKNISEELVKELAIYKPLRVVFLDAGFKSDSLKINVEQIFKHLSPDTEIKTL